MFRSISERVVRKRSRALELVVVALAILGLAVGAGQLRGVEPDVIASPCLLLNRSVIERVMAEPMAIPRTTAGGTGCIYEPRNARGRSVSITAEEPDAEASLESARHAAVVAGARIEDLDHGGFLASSGNDLVHSAEVIRDQVRYRVLIENGPAASPIAVELLTLLGSAS